MHMKTCSDCQKTLSFDNFVSKKSCKDGYEPRCRVCRTIKYNKSTPELLCKKMFNSQVNNSKLRGHIPPAYSLQEFTDWVLYQTQFALIYAVWKHANYPKNLAPSVDRLDNALSYQLNNLQIMTWEANRLKASQDKKENKLLVNHRAVNAYNADGSLYKSYFSMAEAMREFGGKATQSWGISSVCNGLPIKDGKGKVYVPKSYKGYSWKWAN